MYVRSNKKQNCRASHISFSSYIRPSHLAVDAAQMTLTKQYPIAVRNNQTEVPFDKSNKVNRVNNVVLQFLNMQYLLLKEGFKVLHLQSRALDAR